MLLSPLSSVPVFIPFYQANRQRSVNWNFCKRWGCRDWGAKPWNWWSRGRGDAGRWHWGGEWRSEGCGNPQPASAAASGSSSTGSSGWHGSLSALPQCLQLLPPRFLHSHFHCHSGRYFLKMMMMKNCRCAFCSCCWEAETKCTADGQRTVRMVAS